MSKIELDKYYTPKDLAEYCVNKTKEIIGEENISEWLEPSAGCGNFLDYLDGNYLAYDIAPEDDRIVEHDYLTLDLEYKKGRCIIGNPPFGNRNNLIKKFYNKSIKIGDYVAFILPIKMFDNTASLYKFDLVYSEDLNLREYSGVKLHCCFNIYKRPQNGLNKKLNTKLKDIEVISSDPRQTINYDDIDNYDIRICGWGAKAGQILVEDKKYCDEYKIIIHNVDLKDKILKSLSNGIPIKNISTPRINKHHIVKYLKEQIPEIQ